VASGGYFTTLGIPLRSGRRFDDTDRPDGPGVVIISDPLAGAFFPNENPLGKRIRLGDGTMEIVGDVGSIRRAGLRDEPRADLYLPFALQPGNHTTLTA